jgi:site-specific DNA-methyltransferase (adenine-specific)
MGYITLDPCSNSHASPNVPATVHYTQGDNGLNHNWEGNVFLNPPYGRDIGVWTDYLVSQYMKGYVTKAIALVPARTDTQWFQRLFDFPVCFVNGRLKFGDAKNSAPFPSALIALGIDADTFADSFKSIGRVYIPNRPPSLG